MEEIEYESIPNSSLATNMLAGALAGISEHVFTYPLDVLKTRMQFNSLSESVIKIMTSLYTAEGIKPFWRGFNSVLVSAGPAHALYFGAYEFSKKELVKFDPSKSKHLSHAFAGLSATVCHDGFVTPFDGI